MTTSPIIVSYIWNPNNICKNTSYDYFEQKSKKEITYIQLINNLRKDIDSFGFDFDYEVLNNQKSYQDNISYKAAFIKKMLKKHNRPVIYIDSDMKIMSMPLLFKNEYNVDFMAFNWNADPRVNKKFDWYTLETGGGLFYFTNTKNAHRLLNAWSTLLKQNHEKADDRLLAMAFKQINGVYTLKYYWFPLEYYYIPEFFTLDKKKTIVCHPYSMSNENEVVSQYLTCTNSRIPTDYNKIVSKNVKHHSVIIEPIVIFPKPILNKHLKSYITTHVKRKQKNKKEIEINKNIKHYDIIFNKNKITVKSEWLKHYMENYNTSKQNITFWSLNRMITLI